ncbi:hypothetical protein SAMN05216201_108164 [Pseudomonas linyingensis]|uniref:Uncharacterized protein n=1 Tax=Pseudomonas linyingensis TaxID=915471 RepID=A0A1H6YNF2_9PSED|nr:hypothetical protein [Pseudomonas linyingensis]SEJ42811.1 hypothetical protein SAMN05216201_108164 [Pseudomonas linyingensis]
MPALSKNDLTLLQLRGIEVESGPSGTRYVFSLTGLFWLFNHLREKPARSRKQRLSIRLLKELVSASIRPEWRQLRVKAMALPVYSENHYQLAIYLNGSPPLMLHILDLRREIESQVPFLEHSSFLAPAEDTEVVWKISEEERKQLVAGKYLAFGEVDQPSVPG